MYVFYAVDQWNSILGFKQLKPQTLEFSQKAFDPNYRVQAFKKWQRWMHDQAYFAPISNSYELTAVNANVTGWSVKYNSNVWYDAGFVKK